MKGHFYRPMFLLKELMVYFTVFVKIFEFDKTLEHTGVRKNVRSFS